MIRNITILVVNIPGWKLMLCNIAILAVKEHRIEAYYKKLVVGA